MKKELSFEEKMIRLEEIVEDIQGNQVKLDDSIQLFEEGMTLINQLDQELNSAEERVKILLAKNGKLQETDYEIGDED